MRSKFLTLLAVFSLLAIIGCQQTQTSSSSDNKITSLQTVIDKASAGSTIDLSQYRDITDYNAAINKSVTIANGTINSGEITVAADGVTLSNIKGSANVTTNNSMKITGSSISSLTIGETVNANANQNVIISRAANQIIMQLIYSDVGVVEVRRLTDAGLTKLLADDTKITTFASYSESVLIVRTKSTVIGTLEANAKTDVVFEDGASESAITTKSGSKAAEITTTVKGSDAQYYGIRKYHDYYDILCTERLTPTDGVYSLDIAKDDNLWNAWFYAVITQSGKNGRISFQIKTDKATYIQPTVKTAITGSGSSRIVQTMANEWTSVKAYTGKIEQGFTKLILEVPVDTSTTGINVQIKDITYTELDEDTIDDDAPAIITDPGYGSLSAMGSIKTTADKVVFTSKSENDGFNICPVVLPVGNIYRVSFTVTAANATEGFNVFPNVNNSEGNAGYNWGWAMNTHLSANTPTTVVAYLGSVSGAYYPTYEELTDDINKNPYCKIWISPGNVNTLTVENFKAEAVSDVENLSDAQASWLCDGDGTADLYNHNIELNGGETRVWRMVFYGKDNSSWWMPVNSNNKIVCSINYLIYDNQAGDSISITKQAADDNFEITNKTSAKITVTISFDTASKKVIFSKYSE